MSVTYVYTQICIPLPSQTSHPSSTYARPQKKTHSSRGFLKRTVSKAYTPLLHISKHFRAIRSSLRTSVNSLYWSSLPSSLKREREKKEGAIMISRRERERESLPRATKLDLLLGTLEVLFPVPAQWLITLFAHSERGVEGPPHTTFVTSRAST